MLLVSACGSGENSTATSTTASTATFVELAREIGEGRDYQVSDSPAALSKKADLSVIGTVDSVSDGRVFGVGPTREDEPVFLRVVLKVHVDEVLAGDRTLVRDGYVYVELPRTKNEPVEDFAEAIPPKQRLVLFLGDYSEGRGEPPMLETAASVPAGAPVLAPYTEGLLLEDAETGELVGGLAALDSLPSAWQQATGSVNEFVEANITAKPAN